MAFGRFSWLSYWGPTLAQTAVLDRDSAFEMHSLINKIDTIHLWAKLTESDINVMSDTWLKPSVMNNLIHIERFTLFRTDLVNKGEGVAIYVKAWLDCCCFEITTTKFLKLPN